MLNPHSPKADAALSMFVIVVLVEGEDYSSPELDLRLRLDLLTTVATLSTSERVVD